MRGKRLILGLLALVAGLVTAQDVIKLDSLQIALKGAKEDTVKVKTLLAIANLYSNTNYLKALEYSRQARQIAHDAKLWRFEAQANVSTGVTALYQGDYKNASTSFFEALRFYEEQKDTVSYIRVCNNLGATYDRLEDYDKALEYYFKAQDMVVKRPVSENNNLLPVLYNNIANIYQSKGDPKSALEYYEKSLELALKLPKSRTLGQAYNNIGKLYLIDLKQPDKAIEYLMKGLEVREKAQDQGEIARSLIILGSYYLQQKQFEEGKAHATRALEIGEKLGSLDVQRHAYSLLFEIEEGLGRYKQALEAHKSYKKMNDSLQVQSANSEITRLQLQYDFEKTEKEQEEELQQSRWRYMLTIGILSVLLIIAVLITIIIRSRARQADLIHKNLSQDVEIKNKELTTNVMYLIRKNELINNVAERLLKEESNLQPTSQKTIHDIILDLQKEADSDTWKEFELRFNQVHSDFYNKLRKLYPGLSPADEKLCAFLRLNMSSKEIAAITQQSIKSVEVARARLRKKLNLTNTTQNLVSHLVNI